MNCFSLSLSLFHTLTHTHTRKHCFSLSFSLSNSHLTYFLSLSHTFPLFFFHLLCHFISILIRQQYRNKPKREIKLVQPRFLMKFDSRKNDVTNNFFQGKVNKNQFQKYNFSLELKFYFKSLFRISFTFNFSPRCIIDWDFFLWIKVRKKTFIQIWLNNLTFFLSFFSLLHWLCKTLRSHWNIAFLLFDNSKKNETIFKVSIWIHFFKESRFF